VPVRGEARRLLQQRQTTGDRLIGTQRVNDKKLRKCEAVLGVPVIKATTTGEHYVLMAWTDKHHAACVNIKTMEIDEPISHQGKYVAYFTDKDEE
jgi:hypothetical protein